MGVKKTAPDPRLACAIEGSAPNLTNCQQCGGCGSVCPSEAHGGTRPAELMARASLGALDLLEERSIWLCAACMSCTERCPSGAEPGEVVALLREMASEAGNRPSYLNEEAKRFLQTGICFPKTGMTKKMRKDLGLEELEITETALRDVAEMTKRTKLGRLKLE